MALAEYHVGSPVIVSIEEEIREFDVERITDPDEYVYGAEWETVLQFNSPNNRDYYHSFNFEAPTTWESSCCGDTDSVTIHGTKPPSNLKSFFVKKPQIVLYDHFASICSDGSYRGCGLEGIVSVDADSLVQSMTSHIEAGGEVWHYSEFQYIGSVKLPNFSNEARIYSAVNRFSDPVRYYLQQTPDGAVGIAVINPEELKEGFLEEFLSRITPHEM